MDFDASNLRVITFNYDRSFEFYFWRAFRATFKLNDAQADEMLARISVLHVYGHCGELRSGVEVVPYGGNDGQPEQAGKASRSINVVAPRSLPPTTEQIRQTVSESEQVCFLGFAFWKENLTCWRSTTAPRRFLRRPYILQRESSAESRLAFHLYTLTNSCSVTNPKTC